MTAGGQPPQRLRLAFSGLAPEVMPHVEAIGEFLRAAGCAPESVQRLELVAEEVLTNIARYAWPGGQPGRCSVDIEARTIDGAIEVALRAEDDGVAFDPTAAPEPDLDAPLQTRAVGGLGLVLIRRMTTSQTYSRTADCNVFVVTQRCARVADGLNASP